MTNPISPKANNGQALIETVLILPLAIAFISVLLFASYRSLIYFYADAALHEAMICTDSASISYCKNEFEKHIQRILLKNEVVEINLRKNGTGKSFRLSGKVLINSKNATSNAAISKYWQSKIVIQKEMKFPLKG